MPRFLVSMLARHKAVDLVRDGATFTAAGEAVGVSDYAVRQWCKAAGVASVRGLGARRAGDPVAAVADVEAGGAAAEGAARDGARPSGAASPEDAAVTDARIAAAERRAAAAEKRAAIADQRLHALLAAHRR